MTTNQVSPGKGEQEACEPGRECPLCPRLVEFRHHHRIANPDFHNAPVPTWFPPAGPESVRMLIVGLAPGLKGANRTGRPFTGDWAGDLLYETLVAHGFAKGQYQANPEDGLELSGCAITNAVRCVPPQNKPVGAEANACRPFLTNTIKSLPNLQVIVTLGKISHDNTLRALGERVAAHPFCHHGIHRPAHLTIVSSYHCSRYNTNTGVLTTEMFDAVFGEVRGLVD